MTNKTMLEVLKVARELITPESAWIQGSYARSSKPSGRELYGYDPPATCWCARGAIQKVLGRDPSLDESEHIKLAFGIYSLVFFNDTHTHEEVLAAFDAAFERLEAPVGH